MTTPEKTAAVCLSLIGCGLVLELFLIVLLAGKQSAPRLAEPVASVPVEPPPPVSSPWLAWLFLTPLGLLLCTGLLAIYLLPTFIALLRHHQSWMAIAALNCFGTFFLGIGWFPALLWSLAGVWSRQSVHHHYHHALSPAAGRSSS